MSFKETTFAKQIERTAKADAYATAVRFLEKFSLEFAIKVLKEKRDSHREFLDGLPYAYNYATQSLGPKMQYEVTVTEIEADQENRND